ncbi:MAG: CpaF family protein [Pseudomonadota bacterium]
MAMNRDGASRARCFAIADPADGSSAASLARGVASWFSARGKTPLIIDASGGAAKRSGTRAWSELLVHLGGLEAQALVGFLSPNGSVAAVACDGPVDAAPLANISRVFDIILFAIGPESLLIAAQALPALPALVVADVSAEGGLAAAGRMMDRMLEDDVSAHPAGFALGSSGGWNSSADTAMAARLSRRWKLAFWGGAEEIERLALRLIERAVAVPKAEPHPASSESASHEIEEKISPDAKACDDRCETAVRKILGELRADHEFKDLRVPSGDRAAEESFRRRVAAAARRLLAGIDPSELAGLSPESVVKRVVDDSVGFGPIESLLSDPEVTEVMVNGPERVWAERQGRVNSVALKFADEAHLMAVIERMVARTGRRIDESSPMVDARLPDGSRLNVIIPPLSIDGPAVTIRRFLRRVRGMDDAVSGGMLTQGAGAFLSACIRARVSMVISGGTGAGKTTLLGLLAARIDPAERVVTIEDAAELFIPLPHVVRLESRPPGLDGAGAVAIRDLVRNALRMRPDRIVVGECRGPEALDMLQAMNTGHEGSLTTVHANSPRDALARLETMVLMAGMELPLVSVREQIVRAVNLVVQVARRDGMRRVVEISEFTGMEGATPCMQTLAAISPDDGKLTPTGLKPRFAEKLAARGIELPAL